MNYKLTIVSYVIIPNLKIEFVVYRYGNSLTYVPDCKGIGPIMIVLRKVRGNDEISSLAWLYLTGIPIYYIKYSKITSRTSNVNIVAFTTRVVKYLEI